MKNRNSSSNNNNSRKSGSKRNSRPVSNIVAENKPSIDTKALIDKVFEERKFTKLINAYKKDLENNDIRKGLWKVCSDIKQKYPNYFLNDINPIPNYRHLIIRRGKGNEMVIENICSYALCQWKNIKKWRSFSTFLKQNTIHQKYLYFWLFG